LEREREYKKGNNGKAEGANATDSFTMPKKREIKGVNKKMEALKSRGKCQ